MTETKSGFAVSWARFVVRWRWLFLILPLIAIMAVASGGRFVSFTSDYRAFFGADNPQLKSFESLQAIYTRSDNILFVLKPASGPVLTPEWLDVVETLTEDSWQIPYSIRVDSITNFQHTEAVQDDLVVENLVEGALDLTADDISRINRLVHEEPTLANRLISDDSTTTGVQITLQLPTDDPVALDAAVSHAENMAAAVMAKHPDLRVAVTGVAPLSNAFPRASIADMQLLIPLMFGIIACAVFLFLRSFTGTFATLLVVMLSAMGAMGVAGWMGIRLTPPSAMAPIIVLTIAIADCVHILVTMFGEMRRGTERREALIESLRVNTQPVFLTSLTTVIGFMSLNFSDAPPFHDLGNMSAAGVVAAWALSMTFLPALAAILPSRVAVDRSGQTPMIERLGDFIITHRTKMLVGIGILSVAVISMTSRIQLDDRFVEYFDHSIPFRVDSDFARENLSGIYQVEFSLGSGESGGVSNPDYLVTVEAFSEWLRSQPEVTHVNTLTDTMKRLSKSMHGDDQTWYRLPAERDLAAQYLLLFEMSLPYGLDLNSLINVDKSASRLTVTLDNVTSQEMRLLSERSEDWLRANAPTHMYSEGTSSAIMFAYIADRNIRSMLIGTGLAFVLISLTLIFALRSLRIGLISLIPNLAPAAMAFGIWGLFVGELGLAASVIAATSLGLIVDATVHILSKYVRARRERGFSPEDAVRYSFRTVGTALWVTTAVLIAGFAVLAFSSFRVNAELGILTAIAIGIALIIDFLLLPPLLLLLDKRNASDKAGEAKPATA